MRCVLSDFHHIRPPREMEQESLLDWVAKAHAKADKDVTEEQIREKLTRIGLGKERIKTRGVLVPDPFETDWGKMQIYPVQSHPRGHGFAERSKFYDIEVSKILEQFYPEQTTLPQHLVHVTCTGYVAPSPAQKLVSTRRRGTTTTVTHAYHMGCYGSISAIRIAAGFTALPFSSSPQVDIVHTEVCTLHMDPLRHTSQQLLIESLFGDGFIKYTVDSKEKQGPHLQLLALHEETVPASAQSMTWRCEDHGLSMTLSKEVPVLIARAIEGYLERLCAVAHLDKEQMVKEAYFAVHPGGPKILQQIKEMLHLQAHQLEHSEHVLKHFGNMSSATLPHIWERMLCDESVPKNALVASLAFGPGLSIAGGLFKKGV
jgi:predicted naringenin-chalcone synthase